MISIKPVWVEKILNFIMNGKTLTKAPQSWCYVEEI